jgi:hypothetical protein
MKRILWKTMRNDPRSDAELESNLRDLRAAVERARESDDPRAKEQVEDLNDRLRRVAHILVIRRNRRAVDEGRT